MDGVSVALGGSSGVLGDGVTTVDSSGDCMWSYIPEEADVLLALDMLRFITSEYNGPPGLPSQLSKFIGLVTAASLSGLLMNTSSPPWLMSVRQAELLSERIGPTLAK